MAGRRNLAGLFFLRMRDWLKCRVFPAPLRNHLPPMVTGACLREQSVQVHGSTPRAIDRSQWEQKSTYDSANKVGSHPADASLASRGGQAGDAALMAPETNLHVLAGLLRKAALLLTNDTGPMHLGVACRTPTLAPFTVGDWDRWGHPIPTFRALDARGTGLEDNTEVESAVESLLAAGPAATQAKLNA